MYIFVALGMETRWICLRAIYPNNGEQVQEPIRFP